VAGSNAGRPRKTQKSRHVTQVETTKSRQNGGSAEQNGRQKMAAAGSKLVGTQNPVQKSRQKGRTNETRNPQAGSAGGRTGGERQAGGSRENAAGAGSRTQAGSNAAGRQVKRRTQKRQTNGRR